jgi:hypothetical protein
VNKCVGGLGNSVYRETGSAAGFGFCFLFLGNDGRGGNWEVGSVPVGAYRLDWVGPSQNLYVSHIFAAFSYASTVYYHTQINCTFFHISITN